MVIFTWTVSIWTSTEPCVMSLRWWCYCHDSLSHATPWHPVCIPAMLSVLYSCQCFLHHTKPLYPVCNLGESRIWHFMLFIPAPPCSAYCHDWHSFLCGEYITLSSHWHTWCCDVIASRLIQRRPSDMAPQWFNPYQTVGTVIPMCSTSFCKLNSMVLDPPYHKQLVEHHHNNWVHHVHSHCFTLLFVVVIYQQITTIVWWTNECGFQRMPAISRVSWGFLNLASISILWFPYNEATNSK
jgi:hypothetical protein